MGVHHHMRGLEIQLSLPLCGYPVHHHMRGLENENNCPNHSPIVHHHMRGLEISAVLLLFNQAFTTTCVA